MQEMTPEQHRQIIAELKLLNDKLGKQNNWGHILLTGLVYGIGFVIGSTVLATLIIGLFVPVLGDIPWIQALFTLGKSVR